MADIYNDGTYVSNNPDLHGEDSEFKFHHIKGWLESLPVRQNKVRILDIGGGAGQIGRLVADFFHSREIKVEMTAMDLSEEMLKIQKQHNPYISRTVSQDLLTFQDEPYDLVLMIDVIEHIPDKELAADSLNRLGQTVIYNIPIELNLVDKLRNLYTKGRHYRDQRKLLGHIHFFSWNSAVAFAKKNHHFVGARFADYCRHMLSSPAPVYAALRQHRIRRIELELSRLIALLLQPFAPFLIQGSAYILVRGHVLSQTN